MNKKNDSGSTKKFKDFYWEIGFSIRYQYWVCWI